MAEKSCSNTIDWIKHTCDHVRLCSGLQDVLSASLLQLLRLSCFHFRRRSELRDRIAFLATK